MVDPSIQSRGENLSVSSKSDHGKYGKSYAKRHHSFNVGSNHGNVSAGSARYHNNRGKQRDPLGNGSNHNNKSFHKKNGGDPLASSSHSTRSTGSFQHSYKKPCMPSKQQYLAMDCEMVGIVTGESVAARVVLIDWKGRVVLDAHMKPDHEVTDYRTFVSGITKENLVEAEPFATVVEHVGDLLQDKILVGHGLDNDLKALGITHPWLMTRDTAYYQPFMRKLETSSRYNPAMSQQDGTPVWGPRKLKELAKEKLQRDIQVAGISHCPMEDAAAALDLYKSHRPRWEACMSTEEKQQQQQALVLAAQAYNDLNGSMHSYYNSYQSPTRSYSHQMHTPSLHTGYQGLDANSYHSSMGLGGGSYHSHAPRSPRNGLDGHSFHHQLHNRSGGYGSPTIRRPRGRAMSDGLDAHTFHGSTDANPYQPGRPYYRSSSLADYQLEQQPATQRRSSLGYTSTCSSGNTPY